MFPSGFTYPDSLPPDVGAIDQPKVDSNQSQGFWETSDDERIEREMTEVPNQKAKQGFEAGGLDEVDKNKENKKIRDDQLSKKKRAVEKNRITSNKNHERLSPSGQV